VGPGLGRLPEEHRRHPVQAGRTARHLAPFGARCASAISYGRPHATSAQRPISNAAAPSLTPQTTWYTGDTFGLKTADDAGKNFFESFAGQHIRFTEPELFGWLDKYFV
jgi:hypothetical protein